jgi:hypothetical protein
MILFGALYFMVIADCGNNVASSLSIDLGSSAKTFEAGKTGPLI